ncbi:N-acyl-aromatic-L-amino acid amidohydrolase (carboxylate-forming) [Latimeria chalumnae]|uniref:N-acyl-aromatic-L-amino acid amidohydrolase n=1 Tax=Latimeria chalumnae TaxID=7897 RepID=H3A2G8_LATCH|nr:PREDICTED: N-acyl-aromatic-L-amino acid amidohydrolase (carboxylate-forming)-like [Latimeria chalumnae]|eukprot:XP_005999315.1 PREDICTED: N-acyl-aromatic-L-amino acid amidohydrolase (carboxylate-forming)-like [Latimeria chalumnae]
MASQVSYRPLKRVTVAGGTHGNEMAGVFLVKHWLKDPSELRRASFAAEPFVSNPHAVKRCVRYVDRDLNRCFTTEILTSKPSSDYIPYEIQRAKEINQLLGPKGSTVAVDFLIDMHNTTSNMGNCFIFNFPQDYIAIHLVNYLQRNITSAPCRTFLSEASLDNSYSLDSVGQHNLSFELGPQAQGVIRADILNRMRSLMKCALDFFQLFNQGTEFPPCEIEVYKILEKEDYPRDENGELSAIIHPDRQDKDFEPLNFGDPVFQTFGGETITYKGEGTVYPVFINEAAYYEQKIAFWKTQKTTLSAPGIQVQKE